ncbi:MAG: S8 family serine peptidase [Planctomycetota bacterium]
MKRITRIALLLLLTVVAAVQAQWVEEGKLSASDVYSSDFEHIAAADQGMDLLFYDDMESGPSNWSAEDPWGLVTNDYNSFDHSWHDSPSGNYSNSRNISLTLLQEFDLTDYNNVVLEFATKYYTESCCDRGYIEVSTNSGSSWISIGTIAGTQSTWLTKSYILDQYVDQSIRIRFRFYTDSSITYDGWYIDDVRLLGKREDPLVVAPSDEFVSSGDQGGPFDPNSMTYTLTNIGDTSLNWEVAAPCSWIAIDPNGGTLLRGEPNSVDVDIYINEQADTLPRGLHKCEVTFTNTDTGEDQRRDVELCVGAKKILVYTQYVDSTPPMAPEYENVLAALDEYVGKCYTLNELHSYGDLDSMLPGHDVFLIPEPNVSVAPATLEVIGTFWKDTLQEFVNNGGIIVHCDGSGRYGILTGAQLMDISSSSSCSGYSVNVVAPNDPVAEGVSSAYTAQSNSRYYTYDTNDGGTVVAERTGYQEDEAVVIHKQSGGHVILIGHDYYMTNEDQDLIVGNAVFNIDDMVVEPVEGFSSVGPEEGPFSPWQQSYTVANNGPEQIQWEASITCDTPENWLTVDPNGGILSPRGIEPNVVVSLTDDANDLWPGTYDCNVVFQNLESGEKQDRKVSLQVINVLGEIEVTDSVRDPCDRNMPFDNVIVGLTRREQVTITNIASNPRHEVTIEDIYLDGGSYDAFSLSLPPDDPCWTLYDGNSLVVDVNFVPIDFIDYDANIVIVSNDPNNPVIRIVMSGTGILDCLQITPDANCEFSGHPGGPFFPWNTSYELYNDCPDNIDWVAAPNVPWLDVNPTGGTLGPEESILVTVMPNAQAENLPAGYYCGDVNFTNITTTIHQKRTVCLGVYAESKIWTSPQYFDVTLAYGETETRVLTIGNSGSSPFNFALSSRQTSFSPATEEAPAGALEAVASPPYGHDFTVAADVPFVPGELLVRFAPQDKKSWPNSVEKSMILADLCAGATIEREYQILPGLCLVKLPVNVRVTDALVSFNNTAGILYAQPNYELTVDSNQQYLPDDIRFDELWGMHNTGQTGGTPDADIDAPEAWYIRNDASDIIVAVIDTGVDYTHPDLASNMWINEAEYNGTPGVDDDENIYVDDIYGYDFCNNDEDPKDDNSHGTHCAGTIGAIGNNGIGVTGVCWNVKIMAVKFLDADGSGWTDDAIDAVEYSTLMGANLSSNSWGGGAYNQVLKDAIDAAGEAGILFVAAAGNPYDWEDPNNDTTPHYPSSYTSDNIIAVMATDHDDQRSIWPESATSSAYGPTSVDLSAPGTNILSCILGGSYSYENGTSMATPHIAGACALIWSADPLLSHLEVKDIILETIAPLPDINGLCVTGGRLNLYNAMQQAVVELAEANARWLELDPNVGTVGPGAANDVNVTFDANQPPGTYEGYINISSEDVCNMIIPVRMTVEPSDYFTELFEADYFEPNDPNCNDMANRTLIFVPDGSSNYYSACSSEATYLPVDPNGGTIVLLGDDDYEPVTLQYPHVNFYGTNYDTFFISSNGYITFVSPDISYAESLNDHFALPRISLLFDDLNPSAGGTISWKQLSDRIAVTFENVPEYSLSNSNGFQVELFFNGMVRITWLNIDSQDGLVGLSEGMELPADFVESDLSEYRFSGDLDGDCNVDFSDYAVFGSYWWREDCNSQNNWCEGADFEPDGDVKWEDFARIAQDWLLGN